MKIRLRRADYDRVVEYAKKWAPEEACGLLGGLDIEEDGEIIRDIRDVRLIENIEHAEEHFTMTPEEQFKVIKEFRAAGLQMVGNWHSHPVSPSRPSEEDKRLSFDSKITYMILSLMDEEPVFNAFHVENRSEVTKEEVEIVD